MPITSAVTARTIMAEVLSRVTGRPVAEVLLIIDASPVAVPDKTFPADEAEAMIEAMRGEQAGILNWLVAGALKAASPPGVDAFIAQHRSTFRPGEFVHLVSLHDPDCPMPAGGPCTCVDGPEIRVAGQDPESN
jgi:hypothetical protein